MSLASQLIGLRLRRGWTQADLAQRLEVRQATISRWEAGLRASRHPAWLAAALERLETEADQAHTNGILNEMQTDEWADPEI